MNTYEVKFICRDDCQINGYVPTDYSGYENPLGEGMYTEANNADEALSIVLKQIAMTYSALGYEIVDVYGNYLLLIHEDEYQMEFSRGIAVVVST